MARIPGSILRRGIKAAAETAEAVEPALQPQRIDAAAVPSPEIGGAADMGQVDIARANTLSSANLGEYDLNADWQPNFDRMTSNDDVKATIAEMADRNKERIQEARRGTVTHEQLKGLAADLDVDEDVVKKVMERETGGVLNPETILAARQVLNSSADRLLNLAKQVKSGQATDLDRIAFRRQFEFHADYQRQFMGARAEAGRALNAFGIQVGSDPEQIARLKNIVETMNGHDTDELANVLSGVDTLSGVNKLTRDYTQSRVMGVTQELFVNSILSGVKTHAINAFGNVLFQGMNVAETAFAARLGRFLSGDEHVEVGEASAMLYGMLDGWRDGLRLAKRSFKTGEPPDAAAKFETQTRRAISSRNLLPPNAPIGLARAVDALGTFIRIPTERVMMPVDEFFKAVANRSELSRQAYLSAMAEAQANPMTSDQIAEHIRRFMENPPREALASAGDYQRYATFQTPLGTAGMMLTGALNRVPGARLIAPFIQTPANMLKAGLFERSPLAVFSANFRAALREGGPRRDLALARVSMGTLTVGGAALAAGSGLITGGGPQDPKARKVLEATGWQPYSIALTDPRTGKVTYQSYARAEPLSYVIGATADAVEMLAYADYDDELKTDQEKLNTLAASVVAGVANNTMSKTFMQGVMDFSEMLSDPKRYAANWAGGMAGALVPYSSFRRDLARIQDPYIREASSLAEDLRASSGFPGYSEGLPPRRDFFGEPIRYRGGSLLGIMSPFPDSQGKKDPVTDEISRVMQTTREVPVTMPGRRVEGMLLSIDEYDELVRIGRQEPTFNGNTFKDQLFDLMHSGPYELATDDYKLVLIKHAQDRADTIAKALLEERNQVYAERIAAWRLKKARRLYGDAVGE